MRIRVVCFFSHLGHNPSVLVLLQFGLLEASVSLFLGAIEDGNLGTLALSDDA